MNRSDITVEEAHLISELLQKDKTELVRYVIGFINKASKDDNDDYVEYLGKGIIWAHDSKLEHKPLFDIEMETLING